MKRRRLRLFCALATILLASPSCNRIFDSSRPMDLSYAVSVDGLEAQSFEIVLTIGNVTESQVILVSGAQDELLGVEAFTSYDVLGNPLPIERSQTESEISIGGYDRSVTFSRFIIDTEGNDVIVVRYASSPDFEDHGDVYGYIGQEFGLVSGYNLFLAPETDNEIGSVDVQFELPDAWEVVTTWTRQDGSYFPDGHQAQKKRQLLDSWFALGEFRQTQTQIRDTEIRIFGHKGWDETYHEKLVRNAVSLYRYVTDAIDSSPAEYYTMVFLPRSSDGHSVYVPSVATGQARSMDPATLSDWRFVVEDFVRIWVNFEPFKLEFRNPEDRWIIDGFAVYAGIHALSALQETYPNKIQEMLDILYTA